ncbi:FMN-binding negative transcriptional regulator [Bradyrhizobium sp. CCBAU 51627]|uniref:FMN-binding negative transcriptional regulator n=1 Tax=Bradyrhizobium sp. CCBAU 51627 TaxID=1325088 RepID=UPI0023056554|nr:FMN-binding negative transcriptional regulator [Bradyrhizobium sp. CCBAU 51627]MDA9431408.1 transcriptional regulator [Bradyrhizobium sp. CCBAU 51627]
MYIPPAFRDDDLDNIRANIRSARLANLVTATADGPLATPLPLFLDETEGERGVLYGHVARANPQWNSPPIGEALAIFMGPEAYVTPSWYATKQETGKVVPTWNYIAVHAYGPVEFFHDPGRLLEVVKRLTNMHEAPRAKPWTVDEAPADFVAAQLRGIVGLRIPVTRFEGKRKMSQNRPEADRTRVSAGLTASEDPRDREVGLLIPVQSKGERSST